MKGKYGLAVLILFPFAFLIMLSVGRQWTFPWLFPREWTAARWASILSGSSALGNSLFFSLLLSLSIASIVTVLSFSTSRVIAYHRWRNRLLLLGYFPYVMAPVILAACLQYYFLLLGWSGNLVGVMIAQLFITYPFGVIFFTGFWNQRLRAMEQLVATLGGNRRQTYIRVLFPVARGALLVCFFQTFLISWFEYGLTMLIGVGKVQTLTVRIFQFVNEADIFYAALASCLLFLPPMLLLWLNKRFIFTQQ